MLVEKMEEKHHGIEEAFSQVIIGAKTEIRKRSTVEMKHSKVGFFSLMREDDVAQSGPLN